MRILWINHRCPKHPQAGGAEVRMLELGKRLVKHGFKITLLCERFDGAPSNDEMEGIDVKRLGGKHTIHVIAPMFVRNHSNEFDAIIDDVAHAVPWFSPLFTRKPVVGQVHHVHQEVLSFELSPFLARLVAWSESGVKYFYRLLVAVSESTKRDLVGKFGISEERVRVVPNGVDLDVYKPMRKSSKPTVLWVGRVKRYKRVDHVLRAFRIVERKLPDAMLVVVGDGDYLEVLKRVSGRLGLSNVIFTGRVSEEEKVRLMASSWVCVSTSFVEGWGMTITECAACGTPAVAYDVAGLRDSVKDGVTGLLARNGDVEGLADALIKVLEDEGLRLRLSRNALEYAKGFSWERTAREFMKVLKWVVNERA